jgi:TPR repeat protein
MQLAREDCDEGKGDASACHGVAEFLSAVKQDRAGAAALYSKNCYEKNFGPSCFFLGRLFLKGSGVEQNDTKAAEVFGKLLRFDLCTVLAA